MILVVFLSGCVASRNSQPEISKLLGENHRTQRPAILTEGQTWAGADIYAAPPKLMASLVDADRATERQKGEGMRVPVGTPLAVHDIKLFKSDGHTSLTAFGTLERSGTKIPFYTNLGYSGVLNRAPWEDSQTPQKRNFDLFYKKRVEQVGAQNP